MAKKGENIYKRKDGRWEGRYVKSYDINGKPQLGYVYGKTHKEVKEKLKIGKSNVKIQSRLFLQICCFMIGLRNGYLRKDK